MLSASSYRRLSVLLLAVACGSPSTEPARSADDPSDPKEAEPAPEAGGETSDDSPAGWNALVEQGDVWARPELDQHCDDDGRAYFVRTQPAVSYEKPEGPTTFGCEAKFSASLVEVGEADPPCGAMDVAGQTFCCPSGLRAPEPPLTGGGITCEQALYEYLGEQGIDPRTKHPEATGSRGPTFDKSTKVLGRGRYIDECEVDPQAVVEVCAAVRNGQAVGVTVCVQPTDRDAGECIARAVQGLEFPEQDRLDFTETTFEPRGK